MPAGREDSFLIECGGDPAIGSTGTPHFKYPPYNGSRFFINKELVFIVLTFPVAVRGKCAKPSAGMPSGGRSPGTAAMTMTEDAKIEKYTAGSPAVHT